MLILGVATIGLIAAGSALAREHGPGRWDQLDADGDGELTLNEMDAKHREMFDAADTDGDGAVSREEMKAFHKSRRAEHRAKRMGDANGDGEVSRAEFDAHAAAKFSEMDSNGDGVLSDEELSKGRGHKGGHGRRGRR